MIVGVVSPDIGVCLFQVIAIFSRFANVWSVKIFLHCRCSFLTNPIYINIFYIDKLFCGSFWIWTLCKAFTGWDAAMSIGCLPKLYIYAGGGDNINGDGIYPFNVNGEKLVKYFLVSGYTKLYHMRLHCWWMFYLPPIKISFIFSNNDHN